MNPPEELRILEKFVESDGWKWLMTVAKEQVSARTDHIILTPLSKGDDAYQQEFAKGEISGIRLFQTIAPTRIANLRAQLANAEEQTDESTTD